MLATMIGVLVLTEAVAESAAATGPVSVTVNSVSRDASTGNLNYDVTVSASALGSSCGYACTLVVYATTTGSQKVTLGSLNMGTSTTGYISASQTFTGTKRIAAVASIGAEVDYSTARSGGVLSYQDIAIVDSYPTPSVSLSGVSVSRNPANGLLVFAGDVSASNFALADGLCGPANSYCSFNLIATLANGSTTTLQSSSAGGGSTATYPTVYHFAGSTRLTQVVSLKVQLSASSGGTPLYSSTVPVTDPYPTPSVSLTVNSIDRDASTGKLTYDVDTSASAFAMPDGVCAGYASCYLSVYGTTTAGSSVALGAVSIGSGVDAVYPAAHRFTGQVSATQITSVTAHVTYVYGSSIELSTGPIAVTDPYPTPSISMTSPAISRNSSNGNLVYDISVSASSFALPDGLCNAGWGGCVLEVHGIDANGLTVNFGSVAVPPVGSVTYPFEHHFEGEVAGPKIVSVSASIYYQYFSLPPLTTGPVAVTDPYPVPSVSGSITSIKRDPTAGFDYTIDVSSSYYAMQGAPCVTYWYGCGAYVHILYADGSSGFSTSAYMPAGIYAVSYPWIGTISGVVLDKPVASLTVVVGRTFVNTDQISSNPIPFSVGPVNPGESQGGSNPSEVWCQCNHADPVNTATGEFYLPATDLGITGVGPALEVGRTYSSSIADQDGPFGYGWSADFDSRLAVVEPGDETDPLPRQVQVVQENGSTVLFFENDDHEYEADARVQATLAYDGGTWTFTRKTQETLKFNSDGNIISRSDLNGNTLTYNYIWGHLSSISASGGRSISLSWSGSHVTVLSDSAGRSVSYGYDGDGNLVSVAAPDDAESSYGYNSDHYMTSLTKPGGGTTTNIYDVKHRIVSQVDPLGRETTFSYDGSTTTTTSPDGSGSRETYSAGQLLSQVRGVGTPEEATTTFTYDPSSNVASTTDPLGGVSTFTYDTEGNQLTSTDPLGRTTTKTYNALKEILTSTDPLGRTTTLAYDGDGNATSATSPGGRIQHWTHNSNGTIVTATDARGKVTSYTYDSAGRPLTTTDPDARTNTISYDSAGRPITSTDNAGDITAMTYDAAGRVLTVTDPLSHVTTYTYDADGNKLTTTDANSHTTSSTYDVAGQVTSTTDARGKTTSFTYDAAGQLKTVTDPESRTTTRANDALGRLKSVTDPGGNATTYVYDLAGRQLSVILPSTATSRATYDAVGQRLASTDGNGNTTTYAYDAAGQVTSVTDPLSRTTSTTYTNEGQVDTLTLADSSTSSYEYDATGQVVSFTDPDGNVTTYSYDDAGLLTSTTAPGAITSGYSYDVAGRLETTTMPDNTTVANSYDAAGRLVSQRFSASGATDIEFGYDAVGNRTSMTDASGPSSFSYNANGQLTSETNGAAQTLGYTYTDSGLLASITYPGSRTVDYSYTSAGRLGSVTDWNSSTTNYTWTVDGQLATQTDPNGVTQTRSYDSVGQTTDLTTSDGTSTLAQYGYGYDNAGQLVSDSTTDPILAAVAHTYTYDALNQVLSSDDGATAVGYDPTSAGQLVTIGDRTLTYNAAQQLTSVTPTSGSATSFSYDANGSRTNATIAASTPEPAQSTGYGYDAALNLATVTLPGDTSPTVSYTSNGNGLRQSRTEGSTTTDFLWSTVGGLPLLLDDGTNTYIYGVSSTPVAQVDSGDTSAYLFGDLLGSVRLITDATGAVVGTTEYDTYGNRTDHTGPSDILIGYTGNWTDPTTGLVYLRARDYDTTVGQFLTVDPLVDQTHEPYAYALNDPLSTTDLTGMCPESQPACNALGDLSDPNRNLNNLSAGMFDTLTWSPFVGQTFFHDAGWSLTKGLREAFPQAFGCQETNAFYTYGSIAVGIGAGGGELGGAVGAAESTARTAATAGDSSSLLSRIGAALADETGAVGGGVGDLKFARKIGLDVNSPAVAHRAMTVQDYVAQYRKASILRELGSELLDQTVEQALLEGGSTVRKLLTDGRFAR